MKKEEPIKEEKQEDGKPKIFALRTTANREDQVMDFVSSNVAKKKLGVYSIIRAHGMRSYIFVEAASKQDAEQAAFSIPYARGILQKEIEYKEIEHMLEPVKVEMNIFKNDIVEIIAGPFKRENAKVTRVDKTKEEVVLELLEAAVPIPITVKLDSVKVIRRDTERKEEEEGKKEEEEEEMEMRPLINPAEERKAKEKAKAEEPAEELEEELVEEVEEKMPEEKEESGKESKKKGREDAEKAEETESEETEAEEKDEEKEDAETEETEDMEEEQEENNDEKQSEEE